MSLELFRETGDDDRAGEALNNRGGLVTQQGEYQHARRFLEEGLALAQRLGNMKQEVLVLMNLGEATLREGDHERAQGYYREALGLAREVSDLLAIAHCLEGLAQAAC